MLVPINTLFGINAPASITIEVGEINHPRIPAAENYIFSEDFLRDFLGWNNMSDAFGGKEAMYIVGPTGSGKTSGVTQVAARLRKPLYSVTAHSRMETPELIGRFVVVNGSMKWADGPLTMAMKEGHWFLLNEFDYLDPATAAGLNSVLEGNPLEIPETGEVVLAHPKFRFIATANTNGAGDMTGLYQGTLRQNIAAMDRFFITQVDYPTVEQETTILAAVAGILPTDIRNSMIQAANDIRGLFVAGEADVTLSIRTLCRWAKYAAMFQGSIQAKGGDPIRYAFDRALGYRTDTDARKVLHEVLQRTFGNDN